MKNKKHLKIVLNSPLVLSFCVICVIALVIDSLTLGKANRLVFSVYRSSLKNFLTYIRFFTHVLGHASVSHMVGNLMMILVIGPLLEEKYGSRALLLVILITALVTGIAHFILFPGTALLGASGVVFAFILLSSAIGFRDREIPITFILVALLYIGQQIYEGFFVKDNVSQLTHILGGIVGAVCGYHWRKKGR
ncbi:MAG: rhomboid family intramembrane serine protease [Lachnospiraceae bacterium]|nr:rhomboid family intramembrane serine protease [Lachnospiraceae bacterium]